MIKTSLSIDRSHTHRKTLRPTPSIVNIYSIDMTKYEDGFSAESLTIPFRLHAEQLGIDTLLPQQLLMTATFRNPPSLDDDDAVGHPHRGKPMRDEDRHF